MTPDFWLQAWRDGRTGFHRDEVNPTLLRWAPALLDGGPQHVLVPLCGKTLDLPWLASHGHRATGVELSSLALEQLFEREGLPPVVHEVPPFRMWDAPGWEVLEGDVFRLGELDLRVSRVWDRGALVALPADLRPRYVEVVRSVMAPGAKVLLETSVFDSARKPGPPHSVPEGEVRSLWAGASIRPLETRDRLSEARARGWDLDSVVNQVWMIEV